MKKTIFQILTWVGVTFGCALAAILIWMLAGPSSVSADDIAAQKWLQFISVVGTFLLPPVICAWLWDENHRPERWLKMDRGTHWTHFLWAIGIMIVALPAINLLAYLNSLIPMPKSVIDAEKTAEETIQLFLQADNAGGVLVNLGLLALLPALAEEMTFRGTIQRILRGEGIQNTAYRTHIAIWVTAIIFSAIHMQFMGFFPRMLMGALFGYLFVWTGTLWIPIVMHFTNNAIGIILYSIPQTNSNADTMGAGDTIYIGVISLVITCLGLLIFYRRTHTR